MIQAFRTITVDIDAGGNVLHVQVPFTVELLMRVEETLQRAAERKWFRLSRGDKSMVEALEDFCRPYLPKDLDLRKVQPTFCGLFFSSVRSELRRSIAEFMTSTGFTPEWQKPTDAKTTGQASR